MAENKSRTTRISINLPSAHNGVAVREHLNLRADTDQQKEEIVDLVTKITGWRWFGHAFSDEVTRILPTMLLNLYLADLRGIKLSQKALCSLARVDPGKTGARYIQLALRHGLMEVDRRTASDRRKNLFGPTRLLKDLIEADINKLLKSLRGDS